MPFDDDADSDASRFGAPLPPDDRLWRHPSELAWADSGSSIASRWQRPWALVGVSGLAGAILTLGVVAAVTGLGTRVVERQVVERVPVRPAVTDPLSSARGEGGVASVTADVSPSVVRLEVVTPDGHHVGSGVLFRDDGYLLTTAQVVQDAADVVIVLADERELTGTVVGTDAVTDVAVVKIAGRRLVAAVLGSTDGLRVGEPAIAIGSPPGPSGGPSVIVGYVSALGRRVIRPGAPALHDMIQTDAGIADESSGGALVDGSGVVVGITTAVALAGDDGGGAGFAIPIDLAKRVADDIIATGRARHVWLGVEGSDAPVGAGALVNHVIAGGPAAAAGLADGDVIAAVDGNPVDSMSKLVVALRRHRPGDRVRLDYVRNSEPGSCEVTLCESG